MITPQRLGAWLGMECVSGWPDFLLRLCLLTGYGAFMLFLLAGACILSYHLVVATDRYVFHRAPQDVVDEQARRIEVLEIRVDVLRLELSSCGCTVLEDDVGGEE